MRRIKINKSVYIILAVIIVMILGVIICSPINSSAASGHNTTCSQIMKYKGLYTEYSSYTHSSQYGLCTVSVKDTYDKYACDCGASIYLSPRKSHSETHNQPHG